MLYHFYCKVLGKTACSIFLVFLGTQKKQFATALVTAALKTFSRNWWVRNIINHGTEISARKAQAHFQQSRK